MVNGPPQRKPPPVRPPPFAVLASEQGLYDAKAAAAPSFGEGDALSAAGAPNLRLPPPKDPMPRGRLPFAAS
eukprot:6030980-Prymnesium_polylepis.1